MLSLKAYKTETLGFSIGPIEIGGSVGSFLDQASGTVAQVIPSAQSILEQTFNASVHTIEGVVKSVTQVIGASVGLVSWNDAINTLGDTVRSGANVAVLMNPNRYIAEFLQKSPLSAHAFNELNKFTGGMITSGVNVSDLVYRAARGDAISKQELARDAIFALQVGAVIVGGPGAAGALTGNMIGNEVCKGIENSQQRDACKVAFTLVGAAAGAGIAQAYDTNALIAESGEDFAKESYWGSFTENLTPSAQSVLTSRVNQVATQVAVAMCQRNQWAGANECAILGRIGADYLKAPEGTDWLEFLAREAGNLGVLLLLQQAFPQNSPERKRLQQQIMTGGQPNQIIPSTENSGTAVTQKAGISPWIVGAGIVAAIVDWENNYNLIRVLCALI